MTEERIIAYLLKELTAQEEERFEDECWTNETWPEEIELVECDLIDAYLRRELTPERRQSFEQNYLVTHARQERVAAAAVFLRLMDEQFAPPAQLAGEGEDNFTPPAESKIAALTPTWGDKWRAWRGRQTWGLRPALALLCVAVVAGGVWLYLARAPQTPQTPQTPQSFTALPLTYGDYTLGADNGPERGKVTLPLATEALRARLGLPADIRPDAVTSVLLTAPDYKVSLPATPEDAQHISVVILKSQVSQPGTYQLHLYNGNGQRLGGGGYRFDAK